MDGNSLAFITNNEDVVMIHTNHTNPPFSKSMPPHQLPPPTLRPPPPLRPRPKVIRRASFDMALEMGQRRDAYYHNRQRAQKTVPKKRKLATKTAKSHFSSGGMMNKLQRLFMACRCRTSSPLAPDQSLPLHQRNTASNSTESYPHILAPKFDSQVCLVPPPVERVIPPFKPFSKKPSGQQERGFGDGAETAAAARAVHEQLTARSSAPLRQHNGMEPDLDKLLDKLATEEPSLKDAPIEKTFLYLVLKVERQKCQLLAAESELKELRRERDEAQHKVQRLRQFNSVESADSSECTNSDTQSTLNSSRKRHDSRDKTPLKELEEHDQVERTSSAGSGKSNQSKRKSKSSTKRKQGFSNGRKLHPKANCPVISSTDLEVVTKDDEPVVLGQGNCGRVDLMRIIDTGDMVAVKTVLPENQVEPEKWILREVRALKAVANHVAFAQLFGVVDNNPLTTVVVQFVGDYGTLAPITVQSALEDSDPYLSDADWIMVCRDMANGLDALHHKGFLHCDMKMDNVLLWREPTNSYSRWQAKIIDLDSARNLDDLPAPLELSASEKEQCFQYCLHIAPELIEGTTTYTIQTEIYALGLLFSDIADQSQDNIELKRLGAKCLDRKPRRRPKMGYLLKKLSSMKT